MNLSMNPMSIRWACFGWIASLCLAATAGEPACAPAIRAVLSAQMEAWNAGNIPEFMQHYWHSDQLTFSSGGKTTRGWQATLARYQAAYQPESMGTLAFDRLEIFALGSEHALVLGRWTLVQPDGKVGGNFSLVFVSIDGNWVIMHDHTSKLPAAELEN